MCDQAPVCACTVRVASLATAAIGTGVGAGMVFMTHHLMLLAWLLVLCAAATAGGALAVRRSAALAVAYWPSRAAVMDKQIVSVPALAPSWPDRPALGVPARRALPAPVVEGVVVARDDGERIGR